MLTFHTNLGEPYHINPNHIVRVRKFTRTSDLNKAEYILTEIILSTGENIEVKDDIESVRENISAYLNSH